MEAEGFKIVDFVPIFRPKTLVSFENPIKKQTAKGESDNQSIESALSI
jgi:hypothetical protein